MMNGACPACEVHAHTTPNEDMLLLCICSSSCDFSLRAQSSERVLDELFPRARNVSKRQRGRGYQIYERISWMLACGGSFYVLSTFSLSYDENVASIRDKYNKFCAKHKTCKMRCKFSSADQKNDGFIN